MPEIETAGPQTAEDVEALELFQRQATVRAQFAARAAIRKTAQLVTALTGPSISVPRSIQVKPSIHLGLMPQGVTQSYADLPRDPSDIVREPNGAPRRPFIPEPPAPAPPPPAVTEPQAPIVQNKVPGGPPARGGGFVSEQEQRQAYLRDPKTFTHLRQLAGQDMGKGLTAQEGLKERGLAADEQPLYTNAYMTEKLKRLVRAGQIPEGVDTQLVEALRVENAVEDNAAAQAARQAGIRDVYGKPLSGDPTLDQIRLGVVRGMNSLASLAERARFIGPLNDLLGGSRGLRTPGRSAADNLNTLTQDISRFAQGLPQEDVFRGGDVRLSSEDVGGLAEMGTETAPSFAAGPGAGYAMIVQMAGLSANKGYTTAREAGLAPKEATAYAARAGAIDAITMLLFHVAGAGGKLTALNKALEARSLGGAIHATLKSVAESIPQAALLTTGHAINDSLSGVDAEALDPRKLADAQRESIKGFMLFSLTMSVPGLVKGVLRKDYRSSLVQWARQRYQVSEEQAQRAVNAAIERAKGLDVHELGRVQAGMHELNDQLSGMPPQETTPEPVRTAFEQRAAERAAAKQGEGHAQEVRADAGEVHQPGPEPQGGAGQGGENLQQTAQAGPEAGRAGQPVARRLPGDNYDPAGRYQAGETAVFPEIITGVGPRLGRILRVDENGRPLDVISHDGTAWFMRDGEVVSGEAKWQGLPERPAETKAMPTWEPVKVEAPAPLTAEEAGRNFDRQQAILAKLPNDIGKARREGKLSETQLALVQELNQLERILPSESAQWQALWERKNAEYQVRHEEWKAKNRQEALDRVRAAGFSEGQRVRMALPILGGIAGGAVHEGVVKVSANGSVYVQEKRHHWDLFRNPWKAVQEGGTRPPVQPGPPTKPGPGPRRWVPGYGGQSYAEMMAEAKRRGLVEDPATETAESLARKLRADDKARASVVSIEPPSQSTQAPAFSAGERQADSARAPARQLPRRGWRTPVSPGAEALAELQAAGLPSGTFYALDRPFESAAHDPSKAAETEIPPVRHVYDPDGLLGEPSPSLSSQAAAAMQAAMRSGRRPRDAYAQLLRDNGYDAYVRGIDGDPTNRELIALSQVSTLAEAEAQRPPAPAQAEGRQPWEVNRADYSRSVGEEITRRAESLKAQGIVPLLTFQRPLEGGRYEYVAIDPTGKEIATSKAIAGPSSISGKLLRRKGQYADVSSGYWTLGPGEKPTWEEWTRRQVQDAYEHHEQYIRQRVEDGKPVSLDALKDYRGQPWADAELARREQGQEAKPGKQPWEMTQQEYATSRTTGEMLRDATEAGLSKYATLRPDMVAQQLPFGREVHRDIVRRRVESGGDVPTDVLRGYATRTVEGLSSPIEGQPWADAELAKREGAEAASKRRGAPPKVPKGWKLTRTQSGYVAEGPVSEIYPGSGRGKLVRTYDAEGKLLKEFGVASATVGEAKTTAAAPVEQPRPAAVPRPSAEPIVLRGDELGADVRADQLLPVSYNYAKKNFAGRKYINADTGMEISVTGRGLRHALATEWDPQTRVAIVALPRLLEQGRLLSTEAPQEGAKPGVRAVHRFSAPISIAGESYTAEILVRTVPGPKGPKAEVENLNIFYQHTLKGEGPADQRANSREGTATASGTEPSPTGSIGQTGPQVKGAVKDLNAMNVGELRAYARQQGIDLAGAKSRPRILEKIEEALRAARGPGHFRDVFEGQSPVQVTEKTRGQTPAADVQAAEHRAARPADVTVSAFAPEATWGEPGVKTPAPLDLGTGKDGKVWTDQHNRIVAGNLKRFLATTPEFAIDPTFTVRVAEGKTQLLYSDGYRFRLDPRVLGLDAEALKDGQRIRLDLKSYGINPDGYAERARKAAAGGMEPRRGAGLPIERREIGERKHNLAGPGESPADARFRAELRGMTDDQLDAVGQKYGLRYMAYAEDAEGNRQGPGQRAIPRDTAIDMLVDRAAVERQGRRRAEIEDLEEASQPRPMPKPAGRARWGTAAKPMRQAGQWLVDPAETFTIRRDAYGVRETYLEPHFAGEKYADAADRLVRDTVPGPGALAETALWTMDAGRPALVWEAFGRRIVLDQAKHDFITRKLGLEIGEPGSLPDDNGRVVLVVRDPKENGRRVGLVAARVLGADAPVYSDPNRVGRRPSRARGPRPRPADKSMEGPGAIDPGIKTDLGAAAADESGSLDLAAMWHGARAVGRTVADAANFVAGEHGASVRRTAAGKALTRILDRITTRARTLVGKTVNAAANAAKGLTREDKRWLDAIDPRGYSNRQRLRERTLERDRLTAPNIRIQAWSDAYGEMMQLTADEAQRVGVMRQTPNGPQPFAPALGGRYLRQFTPEAMQALWYKTGPLYDAIAAVVARDNGMQLDQAKALLEQSLGPEAVRKNPALEELRHIPNLPDHVQLPDGKWVQIIQGEPYESIVSAARAQAQRIYTVEAVGQNIGGRPTLYERLRALHVRQGGDVADFDGLLEVFYGRPYGRVFKNPRNPWLRGAKLLDTVVAGAQTSLSALVNVPQTLMQVPRYAGPLNYLRAVASVLRHPHMTAAQLAAMGAMNRSVMEWTIRRGHTPEDLSRIIRGAAGRVTGIHWLAEFNNMVAGKAMEYYARGLEAHGVKPGDVRVLRELRLTPREIAEVRAGRMTEATRHKIVQTGVDITQYVTESPHRRSKFQNIPILRSIFDYNNYAIGTAKSTGRMLGDVADAVGSGDARKMIAAGKRLALLLAGSVGAGVASLALRRTVKGQQLLREDEDLTTLEGLKVVLGRALWEVQILGPTQRAMDATSYGGSSAEKTLVNLSPKLSLLADVAGALLGKGTDGRMPAMDRAAGVVRKHTPLAKAAANWLDNLENPRGADYRRVRGEVRRFSRVTLNRPDYGGGGEPRDPDYWPVRQAFQRLNWDRAQAAVDKYKADQEARGVPPEKYLAGLRASLNADRPINLNTQAKARFLESLPVSRRASVAAIDEEYAAKLNELLPAGGRQGGSAGQEQYVAGLVHSLTSRTLTGEERAVLLERLAWHGVTYARAQELLRKHYYQFSKPIKGQNGSARRAAYGKALVQLQSMKDAFPEK